MDHHDQRHLQRRRLLAAVAAWGLAGCARPGTPAAGAAEVSAPVRIDVELDLRPLLATGGLDPARDTVGLRGALPPLGWDRTLPATPDPGVPGLYRLRLELAGVPAQPLAYKFKVDSPGRPEGGWEPGRNRVFMPAPGRQTLRRAWGEDPGAPPPRRTGRFATLPAFASAHVRPREVQLWLPPGYDDDPARRFPVLLLHDGQNVFDDRLAGNEWQVDEAAEAGVRGGVLAPFVVVAVPDAGDRMRDYTPVPARPHGRPWAAAEGGGSAAYGRYLVEELKPRLEAAFRLRRERAAWAVGGSSLGGLVSMDLLLSHPEVFGAALVVSPSVWWGDEALLQRLKAGRSAAQAGVPPPRLWLDVGVKEGRGMVQGARALREALQAFGWPADHYAEVEGAGHDEAAWAARVPGMLRWLYPAR